MSREILSKYIFKVTFVISSFLFCSSLSGGQYQELSHLSHQNFSGSIGGETELKCQVEFPGDGKWIPYTFKWTMHGASKPLFFRFPGYPPHLAPAYEHRVKMTNPANIRMWDLTVDDEGWYHCLISYMNRVPEDMPSPNGTWVYLSILSKPELTDTSEPTIILKEGHDLSLFCRSEGTPPPEILWYRDGYPLISDGRIVAEGEMLRIYQVTRPDAGVYVCRAQNPVGEATHSIKVVLQGGVFIMEPPRNMTVKEGQRIQLTCKAEARPSNISYHWSKADTSIASIPSLAARTTLLDDGSLSVSSVFGTDTGWYYCSATNGLSASTAKAFLNVTYTPKLLHMPKILYLPKQNPAEIPCRSDSNPPVVQVRWFKDGKPVRPSDDVKLNYAPLWDLVKGPDSATSGSSSKERRRKMRPPEITFINSGLSIAIRKAMPHHEGTYTCTPFNSLGPGPTSNPMTVLVRDPPKFTLRPRKYEQRMLKDSVTFPCSAEGDPPPMIVWRKKGGSLPQDRAVLHHGNLTLSNLVLRDAGEFQCLASNVVTTIVASTDLIIEVTTPHAPYNISVTTQHFSASVSWLPAFNSGLALRYVLWFKRLGRDKMDWKTVRIYPDDATVFSIYDLLPDAIYEFSVQSKTRSGDAMFSKVIRIRTKSLDAFNNTQFASEALKKTSLQDGFPAAIPLLNKINSWGEVDLDGVPLNLPYSLVQPEAPHQLKISHIPFNNAINVSWSAPVNTTVPISYYLVQYLSKDSLGWHQGRPRLWTTLTDQLRNRQYVLVKDLRHGHQYDFRVFSFSPFKTFSGPSHSITYIMPSVAPPPGSIVVSTAAIAGLAGGLAFLVVTIVLSIVAVQIVNKQSFDDRTEREKKFIAVKYTDARNTNGHIKTNQNNRISRANV